MTLVPSSFQNLRVIEHLEAKSAYIGSLKYDNLTVNEGRADIGYHFKVKDPNLYKEFEEGDVLGFFKSDDATACVQLLDSQNGKASFHGRSHQPVSLPRGHSGHESKRFVLFYCYFNRGLGSLRNVVRIFHPKNATFACVTQTSG